MSGQGGLVITFADESCVKGNTVVCTAGSSCRAQLSNDAVYDTRCNYSVKLTRNDKMTTEDPVIIVDDGVYDPSVKE